jgi:GTP-binding protein
LYPPLFASAAFATSVAELSTLTSATPEILPELAFVGRSNAGKSTAINLLTQQKRLAFSSKTPGRTQMLNFFGVQDSAPRKERRTCAYLVDLPGYGFARTDPKTRDKWDNLVGGYLLGRKQLRGVVLVMDSRRPLLAADDALIDWILRRQDHDSFRLHFLLSKADQIGTQAQRDALRLAEMRAEQLPVPTSVQLFSSLSRLGLDELEAASAQILLGDDTQAPDPEEPGADPDTSSSTI